SMKPSLMWALAWPNSNGNTMRGLCPRWDAQAVMATRWNMSIKRHSPPAGRFVHSLLDELIAVRQDEGPAAAPLHQEGKDNGFARPRGQDEQGALHPACRGGKQGRDRFVLIRPWCQPKGDGWLGHSLHAVRSQGGGHPACRRRARGPHRSLLQVCLR